VTLFLQTHTRKIKKVQQTRYKNKHPELVANMIETSRRRITVMPSLNEISTDQRGNRVVVRGGGRYSTRRPHTFIQQIFGQKFKDDVNVFFSISDICFICGQTRRRAN